MDIIDDRTHLRDEMDKYCDEEKPKIKAISTSLEINLMIAFLYLAATACSLPVLERDILEGAQNNRFGYLNGYLKTIAKFGDDKLVPENRLEILLRPINVAAKPKWLRETARDLDKSLQRTYLNNQGFPSPPLVLAKSHLARMCFELGISS
jgi:hypothetical protein